MQKMVEYLKERQKGWGRKDLFSEGHYNAYTAALDFGLTLLAEEKAQESLAELADRKKGFLSSCLPPKHRVSIGWEVCIFNGETTVPFFGSTYPEAEANAREYLNGLEDKK